MMCKGEVFFEILLLFFDSYRTYDRKYTSDLSNYTSKMRLLA